MHQFPGHQGGGTFIGFVFKLMVLGFFVLLALKIGPIYLEHFKVATSLSSLKRDPGFGQKTKSEILNTLQKRWDIDMVDDVKMEDVEVSKSGDRVKVSVDYEVVQPLFGNIAVVVNFEDSVESGMP